ncbi:MAG TPA: pantetheine-phosphate adenylyltransferase [Clostridiales bacterium]|nr:pantetheine-phosphate adenylyltransferase [Clostridiales bacterium]
MEGSTEEEKSKSPRLTDKKYLDGSKRRKASTAKRKRGKSHFRIENYMKKRGKLWQQGKKPPSWGRALDKFCLFVYNFAMSKCLVTGSFDPITLGHEDIIEKAIRAFDEVAVAILINPERTPLFSLDERENMIRAVFEDRVEVFSFTGLTVEAADAMNAPFLVRGIRDEADLAYETEMADFNRAHGVETVFFLADSRLRDVSATKARQALLDGNAERYMSEGALALASVYLEEKS